MNVYNLNLKIWALFDPERSRISEQGRKVKIIREWQGSHRPVNTF